MSLLSTKNIACIITPYPIRFAKPSASHHYIGTFTPLSGTPSIVNEKIPAPHEIAGSEGNQGEIDCRDMERKGEKRLDDEREG